MKKLIPIAFCSALSSVCGLAVIAPLAGTACDPEDPTNAVVDNDFAPVVMGGDPSHQNVVFKVWWSSTLFDAPLAAGAESDVARTVTANDYAYVILAPGWDPASNVPPPQLIAMKSRGKLSVKHGDTLHIHVSNGTMVGNCVSGQELSQDDADFITQRIFPGDFSNGTYDPTTCIFTPMPAPDGGSANLDSGTMRSDGSTTD